MYFENKNIYLIGITGIGLSGLAMFLKEKGVNVYGSTDVENKQIPKLKQLNIDVKIGQEGQIPQNIDIVIYTEAINKQTNPEYLSAIKRNLEIYTYREALGILTKDYKLISISGTHGKTTTTSLLIAACLENNLDINAIVGTNIKILDNKNYRVGSSDIFILETCELNGGFKNLHPEILAITNLELDHLESFQNLNDYIQCFQDFTQNVKDKIFINYKDPNSKLLKIENPEYFNQAQLPNPKHLIGDFNQENADCAYQITKYLNLNDQKSLKGIENFQGIDKRMQKISDKIYIDYAHHPTAIKKALDGMRQKFNKQKIVLIYQPHQYSRTRELLNEFQGVFNSVDSVIITDIYECRDTQKDIESVNVEKLISISKHKNIINCNGLQNAKDMIPQLEKEYDIVIIMGAGNISQIYDDLI